MGKRFLALAALAILTSSASAQGWAEKMFPEGINHDFGTVAKGTQLLHKFKIINIYAVRMEITSIKSGCGCVNLPRDIHRQSRPRYRGGASLRDWPP